MITELEVLIQGISSLAQSTRKMVSWYQFHEGTLRGEAVATASVGKGVFLGEALVSGEAAFLGEAKLFAFLGEAKLFALSVEAVLVDSASVFDSRMGLLGTEVDIF